MIYTSSYINEMISEKIKIGLIKDLRKATDEVMMVQSEYDADVLVRLFMKKMNHLETPDVTFGFYHRRLYVWHRSMDEVIKSLEAVGYQGKKKVPKSVMMKRVTKMLTQLKYIWQGIQNDWYYKNLDPKDRHLYAPVSFGPFNTKEDVITWMKSVRTTNRPVYSDINRLEAWAEQEIWHKPGMQDSYIQEAWDMITVTEVHKS